MNMLTHDKSHTSSIQQPFIAEAVFAVETTKGDQQTEKQSKAKQLLDRLFPLAEGSHQDVTSYVIDYHHVLAYFKDGQSSGLQQPKQFVAYVGSKEQPCAILFREGDGSHVELQLGCSQGTGCLELVNIDDIQLESCTRFEPQHGFESSSQSYPSTAIRHWLSLLKNGGNGKANASCEDKEYTAKNGEDYTLSYAFTV